MSITKTVLVAVFVFFVLVLQNGCGKKAVKRPPGSDLPPEEVEEVNTVVSEQVGDSAFDSGTLNERELTEAEINEKIKKTFKTVYFGYNEYDLSPEATDILSDIASYMSEHQNITVRVEGHCDERGSNQYNMVLSEKRGNSIKDYLVSYGISDDRVTVKAYGEERPAVNAETEEEYALNRRAEFKVKRKQ